MFTITFIESSPDALSISREKIVDLIGANKVVVLSGETGCGKTTQVTIWVTILIKFFVPTLVVWLSRSEQFY